MFGEPSHGFFPQSTLSHEPFLTNRKDHGLKNYLWIIFLIIDEKKR